MLLGVPSTFMGYLFLGAGDGVGFACVVGVIGLTEGGVEFIFESMRKTAIDYDARLTGLRREA